MSQGIRISKRDYSVFDADQKQLLVSDYPLLKLYESGQGTLTKSANSGEKIIEITHNLGYIPQVFVFGEYLDENDYPTATVVSRYRLFNFSDTPGLDLWEYYTFYADTTKLYIKLVTNSYFTPSISLDYIYYIFYDPLT